MTTTIAMRVTMIKWWNYEYSVTWPKSSMRHWIFFNAALNFFLVKYGPLAITNYENVFCGPRNEEAYPALFERSIFTGHNRLCWVLQSKAFTCCWPVHILQVSCPSSHQHTTYNRESKNIVWSVICPLNIFPVQADDDGSGGG